MLNSRRRLPPLNSLRAFEAVARHLSVSRAAEELAVTPAAVTQQLRQLEDVLGVPLVRRQGRNLELTPQGDSLGPGLIDAFERMAACVRTLMVEQGAPVVRLSVPPSFADRWLVPRLGGFLAARPEIDVHVDVSMGLADLLGGEVDAAVRFGRGAYGGLDVTRLLTEEVFPVCAPPLLTKLRSPADLSSVVLIHDSSPSESGVCPDWRMWLAAAGVEGVEDQAGPRFNQSSLVLEAAAHGLGVALAKGLLAREDLRSGRLVRPFAGNHAVEFGYFFVASEAALRRPAVRALRDWLKDEARRVDG